MLLSVGCAVAVGAIVGVDVLLGNRAGVCVAADPRGDVTTVGCVVGVDTDGRAAGVLGADPAVNGVRVGRGVAVTAWVAAVFWANAVCCAIITCCTMDARSVASCCSTTSSVWAEAPRSNASPKVDAPNSAPALLAGSTLDAFDKVAWKELSAAGSCVSVLLLKALVVSSA